MILHSPIDFPVEIIRTSRRKTASIEVVDGKVRAIVPTNLSDQRVIDLINTRKPLIRTKLRLQAEHQPAKPKEYVSGECITYLGKNYRLKLMSDGPDQVKLHRGYFELGVKSDLQAEKRQEFVKKQLIEWHQSHAEKRLVDKTSRYAKILNVKPNTVSVTEFKSRWGSCSTKGDVGYNWKIIIAPHNIIDYVVVHELCHLIEHNHSPAYWKCVERIMPNYRESKEWLKVNGAMLLL